jgi:hypothetical protein
MFAVRLHELEEYVDVKARAEGVSKSELVRRIVADYAREHPVNAAWEEGKDLFGRYASGESGRSSDRRALVRKRVRSKHA